MEEILVKSKHGYNDFPFFVDSSEVSEDYPICKPDEIPVLTGMRVIEHKEFLVISGESITDDEFGVIIPLTECLVSETTYVRTRHGGYQNQIVYKLVPDGNESQDRHNLESAKKNVIKNQNSNSYEKTILLNGKKITLSGGCSNIGTNRHHRNVENE